MKDIPHFLDVIDCESDFLHDGIYGDGGASFGAAQFQKRTFDDFKVRAIEDGYSFEHFDYYNVHHQIELMAWAFANDLSWHWTCDELVVSPPPQVDKAVDKAVALKGTWQGECVAFLKKILGSPTGLSGVAKDIKPNATEPVVGEVVLLNESPYGHVALITDIVEDRLVLCESNYDSTGIVSCGREIEKTDGRIRGYYRPDTYG